MSNNYWVQCKYCKQMKRVQQSDHACPEAAMIKREIEIDEIVGRELEFLDLEIDHFWAEPRTKFMRYLIERGDL